MWEMSQKTASIQSEQGLFFLDINFLPSGKAVKCMGHMKVILVATAYMISEFLFSHNPEKFKKINEFLNWKETRDFSWGFPLCIEK